MAGEADRPVEPGYRLPTYPYRRAAELASDPAEARAARSVIHPLVIVGGGLSGLTAACDCADRGMTAILLDEDDTVGVRGASSRGICYAQRSLEIFARLGLYDRLAARGVRWHVGRTLAGHDEVYRFDLTREATLTHSAQPAFINIQQYLLESFLVDRTMALGRVDLRWKNRVQGITIGPDDEIATLSVSTPDGDYPLRARHVIDATGVKSALRDALGIATRARAGIDRWCISDVRFRGTPAAERWTWIEAPFNENRAVWQHLMADDVWRLDYQMAPDSDPQAISRPEVVDARLRAQFGDDVDYELVWVGPYGYRSHVMDRFRHGPVFFVGDSAHGMSPFGARGGNSGIQDADNLIWKLDWVQRGHADPSLLDSYHVERREAARVNVAATDRTMRFLTPHSPAEHRLRTAVLDLARRHPFARTLVNTGRMSVATRYTGAAEGPPGFGPVGAAAAGAGTGGGELVSAAGDAGRPLQNLSLAGDAVDLVGLIRAVGGRMLVIAADAEVAARVPVALVAADLPVAWWFDGDAAGVAGGADTIVDVDIVARSPLDIWRGLHAGPGAKASLAAMLGLLPGHLLLVRPDLHSAGLAAPDAIAATLAAFGLRGVPGVVAAHADAGHDVGSDVGRHAGTRTRIDTEGKSIR